MKIKYRSNRKLVKFKKGIKTLIILKFSIWYTFFNTSVDDDSCKKSALVKKTNCNHLVSYTIQ